MEKAMGKCPLCGSDGDDLVFRFYCSSRKCVNFAPQKTEGHLDDKGILRPGEVFWFGKPSFVGCFPVREDMPIAPRDPELCRETSDPKITTLNDEFEFHRRREIGRAHV